MFTQITGRIYDLFAFPLHLSNRLYNCPDSENLKNLLRFEKFEASSSISLVKTPKEVSMSAVMNIQRQQAPGCCASLAQSSKDAAVWLGRGIKSAGVAAWEGTKKAASFAASLFSKLAAQVQKGFVAARDFTIRNVLQAKAWWNTHPGQAGQIKAGAMGAAAAAVVTGIACFLCCRKKPEAVAAAPVAAPVPAPAPAPAAAAPAPAPAAAAPAPAPAAAAPAPAPAAAP